MVNKNKVSRAELVAFDKQIKTNLPDLEGKQSRSNFSLFEDQFADSSLVSIYACFLDRTSFTIGTFTQQDVFFTRSTPVPPEDEFHILAYLQNFSNLSVLFVTQRHIQNSSRPTRARRQRPSRSPS